MADKILTTFPEHENVPNSSYTLDELVIKLGIAVSFIKKKKLIIAREDDIIEVLYTLALEIKQLKEKIK